MAYGQTSKIVRVAAEQHNTCYYCGLDFDWAHWDKVTLDHKLPKSRGGSSRRDNLVACCARCNMQKGMLTEAEFWTCFERAHDETVAFLQRKYPDGAYTFGAAIYITRFQQKLGGLTKSWSTKLHRAHRRRPPLPWPPRVTEPIKPCRWPPKMFDIIERLATGV